MYRKRFPIFLFLSFFFAFGAEGQYILNGSAQQVSCNCYTLTTPIRAQSGSVWNSQKIDLAQPFDFWFNVFLGCDDGNGADGIVFMLQPLSTSVGTSGEGMGFQGVTPSIGISLDTWTNNNLADPFYDHISIQANGNANHNFDLASPVPISATSNNVEDCNWHKLRIAWDPAQKTVSAYFDGILRVSYTGDIIQNIFNGNANVYWGFSAATGGAFNLQQFCTALNPEFTTTTPNDGTCIGTALPFNNNSVSFTNIAATHWDFGDGSSSNEVNPPAHLYAQPGTYPVKLAITAQDGCKSDTFKKNVTVASIPDAAFEIYDTCFHSVPRLVSNARNVGVSYLWTLNGDSVSAARQPALSQLPAGSYRVQSQVRSLYGCGTDVEERNLTIKPIPEISGSFEEQCINLPTFFSAEQEDNNTVITQWMWDFGDNNTSRQQNPEHIYRKEALFPVKLWAHASNGCTSDTAVSSIRIVAPLANAGNDTMVLKGTPFVLQGSGKGRVEWTPSLGLNRTDILAPQGSLNEDQTYLLTAITPEGCVATDEVKVEVFKGSSVYVPTAFTPNGNGRNDVLKPQYTGINRLNYFTVYNRWGQVVFTTGNRSKGWDGTFNGKPMATGTFIWIVNASDVAGHRYQLKGSVTLIR